MPIKQYEIWIADLNPQIGTETGKTRPVLTIQTNLLNKIPHPSTIVCPITTNVKKDSEILTQQDSPPFNYCLSDYNKRKKGF